MWGKSSPAQFRGPCRDVWSRSALPSSSALAQHCSVISQRQLSGNSASKQREPSFASENGFW